MLSFSQVPCSDFKCPVFILKLRLWDVKSLTVDPKQMIGSQSESINKNLKGNAVWIRNWQHKKLACGPTGKLVRGCWTEYIFSGLNNGTFQCRKERVAKERLVVWHASPIYTVLEVSMVYYIIYYSLSSLDPDLIVFPDVFPHVSASLPSSASSPWVVQWPCSKK